MSVITTCGKREKNESLEHNYFIIISRFGLIHANEVSLYNLCGFVPYCFVVVFVIRPITKKNAIL